MVPGQIPGSSHLRFCFGSELTASRSQAGSLELKATLDSWAAAILCLSINSQSPQESNSHWALTDCWSDFFLVSTLYG
jgi:hypothetical protein